MKIIHALAATAVLVAASAHAQPRAQTAPQGVSPAQVEAAERALMNRTRATFRAPPARLPDMRLAAVRAVRQTTMSGDLGETVKLTPRAPFIADRAWLATALVTTMTDANLYALEAWPDAFAPHGGIEVVIKTQPGKRYLVECNFAVAGASGPPASLRGTISAMPGSVWETVKTDAYSATAQGSVVSVITPAGLTAPMLKVSFDYDPNVITAYSIAATDGCEVTPFPG